MSEELIPSEMRRRSGNQGTASRMFLAKLGQRIKIARQRRGKTQAELADAIGIHRTYLSSIERGRANPSVLILRSIAAALDFSVQQLIPEDSPAAAKSVAAMGRPRRYTS
jgi:transcriptional regulator with XRE-family HTH domain